MGGRPTQRMAYLTYNPLKSDIVPEFTSSLYLCTVFAQKNPFLLSCVALHITFYAFKYQGKGSILC